MVDVLEVGDAACEARLSTSSKLLVCQPLFTLTMAYDNLVLNSAESCAASVSLLRKKIDALKCTRTSPIVLPAVEATLTALVVRECPFTGLQLPLRALTPPSAILFLE
jgi:hypothetical protein